jgi:NAD-dependent deacetylase
VNERDLDDARSWIRAARSVAVFSGAGLSTESGVPTFRDAGTDGFWTNYDPVKLASPQGFAADRQLVISWYGHRRKRVADVEPNPAHRAVAAFEARYPDRMISITQNIDGLLQRAGANRVLELHGTLFVDRCNSHWCSHRQPADLAEPDALIDCPKCGEAMRPAVVWFGEPLPTDVWIEAEEASLQCDVMLVVGTSGEVYPANGLVSLARTSGAKVIVVNPNESALDGLADLTIHAPAAAAVPKLLAVED